MMYCDKCKKEFESGKFCPDCGNLLKDIKMELFCPKCGKTFEKGKFCPDCGAELKERKPFGTSINDIECPACGSVNAKNSKYCDTCGFPLDEYVEENRSKYIEEPADDAILKKYEQDVDVILCMEDDKIQPSLKELNNIAEKGSARAELLIGDIYFIQLSDFDNAIEHYLKAGEAGISDAWMQLGFIYDEEKKNYLQAKVCYEKAFALGDADAKRQIQRLEKMLGH